MDTEAGKKKQMAKEPSELFGMTKTFFTIIWAHSSATALHSNTILRELKRLMHYSDFSPPRVCNFCQRLRRRRAGLSGNTQCSYNNCPGFCSLVMRLLRSFPTVGGARAGPAQANCTCRDPRARCRSSSPLH